MKLLITGSTGLLGRTLASQAGDEAIGVSRHTDPAVDLTDKAQVEALIAQVQPDVIIHAAAMTSVEGCEQDTGAAEAVNVGATRNLLEAAPGARFVFVSTDSVFNGQQGDYIESDATDPIHVYGKTKLAAEQLVLNAENNLVVRTAFFGKEGGLAQWALNQLEAGATLTGYENIFFSPIFVTDLAEVLLELAKGDATGVLHVAGSEGVSKYEFLKGLAQVFGFTEDRVVAQQAENAVKRPNNVTLNVEQAQAVLGKALPNLEQSLQAFYSLSTVSIGS